LPGSTLPRRSALFSTAQNVSVLARGADAFHEVPEDCAASAYAVESQLPWSVTDGPLEAASLCDRVGLRDSPSHLKLALSLARLLVLNE